MGFVWSKPTNPLKESLLPGGPTVALNTGDIILIPNSDLEIVLNNDIWKGVGIALSPFNDWYDGEKRGQDIGKNEVGGFGRKRYATTLFLRVTLWCTFTHVITYFYILGQIKHL